MYDISGRLGDQITTQNKTEIKFQQDKNSLHQSEQVLCLLLSQCNTDMNDVKVLLPVMHL